MKLSEMRHHSTAKAETTRGSAGGPQIRNVVAYQRPINALYNGQPVTLIATGDIEGMSPAEKFVDENGKLDWAPSDEFTVDDRSVVPQTTEQRQKLLRGSER